MKPWIGHFWKRASPQRAVAEMETLAREELLGRFRKGKKSIVLDHSGRRDLPLLQLSDGALDGKRIADPGDAVFSRGVHSGFAIDGASGKVVLEGVELTECSIRGAGGNVTLQYCKLSDVTFEGTFSSLAVRSCDEVHGAKLVDGARIDHLFLSDLPKVSSANVKSTVQRLAVKNVHFLGGRLESSRRAEGRLRRCELRSDVCRLGFVLGGDREGDGVAPARQGARSMGSTS